MHHGGGRWGGGAAPGGGGGDIVDGGAPQHLAGGPANGTDDLQPLLGGCAGGGFHSGVSGLTYAVGSAGGGALQITSRTSITVSGTVNMDGYAGYSDGYQQSCGESWFGGDGGEGILLEAPIVSLAAHSTLSAAGGDGFGCDPALATCGTPGHGGNGIAAATLGGDVTWTTALGSSAVFASGTGEEVSAEFGLTREQSATRSTLPPCETAIVTNGMLKTR